MIRAAQSNTTPLTFTVLNTTLNLIKDKKLKAIAIASSKRSVLLPEIPTIAESGYSGVQADSWFGLFAPVKTSRLGSCNARRGAGKNWE